MKTIDEISMNKLLAKINGDMSDIQNFINVCSLSGSFYDRRSMGKTDEEISEWIKISTPKVLIMALKLNIAEHLIGQKGSKFEKYKAMIKEISALLSNKNQGVQN